MLAAALAAITVLSGCNTEKPAQDTTTVPTTTQTGAESTIVTSVPETSQTSTTTTTTAITTTAATAAEEPTKQKDFSEELLTAEPILKRSRAVKQLDAIEAFDLSSDDMSAVIGELLAGNNIAWAACQDRDVREYLKDTEGVHKLFDSIYTRECADSLFETCMFSDDENGGYHLGGGWAFPSDMTDRDNYFKITDVTENECTFLFFCCENGFLGDDYEKPDTDYYDVYEEKAVREDGVWKLPETVHNLRETLVGRAECNKQFLVTRLTNHAHSSRKAERQLEEDYTRFIRDYALGVWQLENTDKLYVSGINNSFRSYEHPIGIQYGDRPVMVYIDDETAELYLTTDYIADLIKMTVYADEPDVLIVEDIFGGYDGTKYVSSTERYIRTDTAVMYPETGIVTRYIHERLTTRWLNTHSDSVNVVSDGTEYNNDFRYRADGANNELTLIEDNGDSLVFSSLFRNAGDMNAPVEKRFRYEIHRTDEGMWELGEYEEIQL